MRAHHTRDTDSPRHGHTQGVVYSQHSPPNHDHTAPPTYRSAASSSALAYSASSFLGLGHSLEKWPRTPQLKHLPLPELRRLPLAPERTLLAPSSSSSLSSSR